MLVIVSKGRGTALLAYHDGLRLVGPDVDDCAGVFHKLDDQCIVCRDVTYLRHEARMADSATKLDVFLTSVSAYVHPGFW